MKIIIVIIFWAISPSPSLNGSELHNIRFVLICFGLHSYVVWNSIQIDIQHLCRNKLVSLRSTRDSSILIVYIPLWVLKVTEMTARNKAAHSSFLCFYCCLTRQNIIIQCNRDGNMFSCHKTTSVLQTVTVVFSIGRHNNAMTLQ